MAWEVHYRTEWTDILGLDWKAEIEESAYGGAVVPMQCSGNPLRIDFLAQSDDLYDNSIKGSKADLSIESENFQWADLYTVQDMQFRMSIYHSDTTLYWRGYVMPDNYSEPYNTPNFTVTISASDGLGYLKNYLYKYKTVDEDDTYYDGRRLESQIIIDILGKLGVTTFTEFVNIYEESMDNDVGDSPMDQLKIDVDVFKDMYCYEVLEQILKKYNAVIRQRYGVYIIYRPVELTGATVYGRIFTAAATKTPTTLTPLQNISRRSGMTDLRDVNGGTLMIQSPVKKVTIFQDYGNNESWIKNWKFEGYRFTGGGANIWVADKWTNVSCVVGDIWPIGIDAPNEKDGIVLANSNNYPDLSKYIQQSFGPYNIISASDVMCFEFEYQWFNRSGDIRNIQQFFFSLESVVDNYSLKETDDSYCEWVTPKEGMSVTEDVADGSSGWKTWRRMFTGIETNADLRIKFILPDDAYFIGLGIRNVRFTATNDTITIKRIPRYIYAEHWPFKWIKRKVNPFTKVYNEIQDKVTHKWEKTNAINGVEQEYDMILGDCPKAGDPGTGIDNNLEQFAGSLASSARDTLIEAAADFVTDHAADYVAGGVVVTSDDEDIIFTSSVAGVEFTGNTTITNTSDDLDGNVVNTQANVTAVARIDRIDLSGSSGSAIVVCNAVSRLMNWDTNLEDTADAFVTAFAADYNTSGVELTAWGTGVDVYLRFKANVAGTNFTGATSITNDDDPDLDGEVYTVVTNRVAVKRIDTITLTGTVGTADILCDGVTEEVDIEETISYTTDWNTRGGAESKELLSIVCDELAEQYSRPKHFLTLPIMENNKFAGNLPHIDIMGNFQDSLNKVGGNNRKFVFNKGGFNIRDREWNLDLIEII